MNIGKYERNINSQDVVRAVQKVSSHAAEVVPQKLLELAGLKVAQVLGALEQTRSRMSKRAARCLLHLSRFLPLDFINGFGELLHDVKTMFTIAQMQSSSTLDVPMTIAAHLSDGLSLVSMGWLGDCLLMLSVGEPRWSVRSASDRRAARFVLGPRDARAVLRGARRAATDGSRVVSWALALFRTLKAQP